MKKMNFKIANNTDLIEVLRFYKIYPQVQKGTDAWFLSPFQKERTPSFKVNIKKNVWYDHGEGIGGTVIDLVMKLNNCSINEGLKLLGGHSLSFHQREKVIENLKPNFEIQKICTIQHFGLVSYLHSRKIDISIARSYCKEIHYCNVIKSYSDTILMQLYDNSIKPYYAIALLNDKGGYEVRNKYFKGCIGSKAITTINNSTTTLNIFESLSDFLSYLTLRSETQKQDFIITNSTALIEKALPQLHRYQRVNSFFDNDEAGLKATQILKASCENEFKDFSATYKNYKDLNEYLMKR